MLISLAFALRHKHNISTRRTNHVRSSCAYAYVVGFLICLCECLCVCLCLCLCASENQPLKRNWDRPVNTETADCVACFVFFASESATSASRSPVSTTPNRLFLVDPSPSALLFPFVVIDFVLFWFWLSPSVFMPKTDITSKLGKSFSGIAGTLT